MWLWEAPAANQRAAFMSYRRVSAGSESAHQGWRTNRKWGVVGQCWRLHLWTDRCVHPPCDPPPPSPTHWLSHSACDWTDRRSSLRPIFPAKWTSVCRAKNHINDLWIVIWCLAVTLLWITVRLSTNHIAADRHLTTANFKTKANKLTTTFYLFNCL